jgi:exosome complex component RRP4
MNGRVYASVLGLLRNRPPEVQVIPLSGRYVPKAGDVVLGTVTDAQSTFWLLDIGGARWAPLHMTGTPWKVEVGETEQYLRVGDAVVVAVESIENTGRIGVTMVGEGLGKLEGGTIITISPAKVPRVIGRGGSMIQTITRLTGTQVVVGQNGRVWVDGPHDGIARVREALRIIEEEGHRAGLTERVQALLEGATGPVRERSAEGSPLMHGHSDRPAGGSDQYFVPADPDSEPTNGEEPDPTNEPEQSYDN